MKTQLAKIASITILGLILSATASATDFAQAKAKATSCFGCHGEHGVSVNGLWPNLAGQKKDYLIKQLVAFRAGDRKDPVMNPMAAQLNDQDIQDIALYFSSLK